MIASGFGELVTHTEIVQSCPPSAQTVYGLRGAPPALPFAPDDPSAAGGGALRKGCGLNAAQATGSSWPTKSRMLLLMLT